MSDVKMCLYPQCNAPLPKGANKYCPGTDHYQQHMTLKSQLRQQRTVEEKKMTVASRTVTETFAVPEERHALVRAEMYFMETEERLQQARVDSEVENRAEIIEKFLIRYGILLFPAVLVVALSIEIGAFLAGNSADKSWYFVLSVLFVTAAFEALLMLLSFGIRRLQKRIVLAPTEALPMLKSNRFWAFVGWGALALVSFVAQFGALTNMNFTNINALVGVIVGVRCFGTTVCDFVIAVSLPLEIRTPSIVAAELKQEAFDLTELATAYQARLLAQRKVRQTFLELQSPTVVVEDFEVQS
jgi:hypothetical protein